MLSALLAAGDDFIRPVLDYHAIAPEIVLAVGLCVVLLADLFLPSHRKWVTSTLAGVVLLATLIPVLTLALHNHHTRSLFSGAYVVDDFSLVLKALFLIVGYIVVLMSSNYLEEGDYYQGEYWVLLLSSVLGMVMMASSRDLVSIFVALEFLSIPAYMLAAWRKRDLKSNEAGLKYFLLGVFASAVMLYGMSLMYGAAGSTVLSKIGESVAATNGKSSLIALAVVFVVIGFAFKVSAVPFHTWAPDTYQGAPTPITAFLSVASKTAGFVALIELVLVGFPAAHKVWQPLFWVLSALTMTIGNLMALKQTNIVRLLAYSSVAQGGFILMPMAVAHNAGPEAVTSIVSYLIIYAATNLGAFSVILAVTRRTRRSDVDGFDGLFSYAPGLAVVMTLFLASLAGVPPGGGFFAKLSVFRAVLSSGGGWGAALACIGAINSVVAFGYYGKLMRSMWMNPAADGNKSPIRIPQPLVAALAITGAATLVLGVVPNLVLRFGDLGSNLVAAVTGS
jgi:NADH-quinone oxidoreductase subunit N